MPNKLMHLIWIILSAAIFLLAACTENSIDNPELSNSETIAPGIVPKEKLPVIPTAPQPPESENQEAKIAESPSPAPVEEDPLKETAGEEIEWGKEVDLAEMIAKARSGEIREIQWHVMPNVLRAQAFDDHIFHLKNENKGVDLRNTLINAGVKVGRGGVTFNHVF